MRWDELFADLESQLERELGAEELDLQAEEERLRLGRLALRDRLAGAGATPLEIWLLGGQPLRLRIATLGRDWCSGDVIAEHARPAPVIVPLAAIAGVGMPAAALGASLDSPADADHPSLGARLGLSFVLRDLCRRRRALELDLGAARLHGTVDRVGRDHLDLAVHEPGSARRPSAVSEVRLVPFAAIRLLRL